MGILSIAVFIYLGLTLLLGFYASRYVKNAEDFIVAGRSLPMFLSASVLFATWFGSETVLGASSEFLEHGLYGVIEDPFGAALCLFLIAAFFARPLYRLKLLTFGDFYRQKYSRGVELVSSLFMVPSYFGWIAAQLVAMGIIIQAITGLPLYYGIVGGAILVSLYTYVGGMWAVSLTDFVQSVLIILGLITLAFMLYSRVDDWQIIKESLPPDFFRFHPRLEFSDMSYFVAAWITIGLGSIPQQDIYQRVMAAKSEKVAVRSAYLASVLYLSIALIPLFIALLSRFLYPELLAMEDKQMLIPLMVLHHSPLWMQMLFFGALLSAILSTTSGAILAPASILSENLIKPLAKKQWSTRKHLNIVRLSVLVVAAFSLAMALWRGNIYELVAESSAISLVSLFVPLVAGLWWKKTSPLGAHLSMFTGFLAWLIATVYSFSFPPILFGFFISALAMVLGYLLENRFTKQALK